MGTITRSFANLITASGPSSVSALGTLTVNNIQFPATKVASANDNNLDDFEEGTWTPTYVAASTNFDSVTYEQQVGKYTKIGRMVILTVTISTTAITKGSAAGDVYIDGLPFVPDQLYSNATVLYQSPNWAGDVPLGWTCFNASARGYLYYKSGVNSVNIDPADMGTGGSANNFAATLIYLTTS